MALTRLAPPRRASRMAAGATVQQATQNRAARRRSHSEVTKLTGMIINELKYVRKYVEVAVF